MYTPLSSLDGLSSVLYDQQSNRQSVSATALNRGLQLLQQKKYEDAVKEFKRAAAFDPESENAYTFLGKTYMVLGNRDAAVRSYLKAIQLAPQDADARANLGQAYVDAKDYDSAVTQYRQAIRLDPGTAQRYSSLGYVYMLGGRYADAAGQFAKVIQMSPSDADGYHSLGAAYSKEGRYTDAVAQFDRALSLRTDFPQARADLAYAYLGLGQTEQASNQVDTLLAMNTTESNTYAVQVEAAMFTPKIESADTHDSTFNPYLTANAPLYVLDPSLATAGASTEFTMVFTFNQDMDIASVQNVLNWSISKSTGGDGGVYDNGVSLDAQREVGIMPLPLSVSYDPATRQATVRFRITQNANGDGIIDPSHWVFRFSGKDASGHAMDPAGDEWDGFARTGY